MKIAVSSDSSNLSARVAQRFGISPYLIIVDPETMEIEAVPNPGAAGKQAAGIQAVVIAISKEVDTVLTGYCSPTAMKYLAGNPLNSYVIGGEMLEQGVSLFAIMISYFGWVYVALLTLFTVSGSLAVGYLVNTLAKD